MSLRDEVRELLTLPDKEDGYECEPAEVEVALDNYEAAKGKIDNLPSDTDCEDVAEEIYSSKTYWPSDSE